MKKPTPVRKSMRPSFRPRLEVLEPRLTPTTYTVSSLADSGDGSLRAAITNVNADTSADEIDFSVAGIIKLTSGVLPDITNTVKIDASTAPGFTSAPVVELNINGFGTGFIFDADLCTLQALSVVGGSIEYTGVLLKGNSETVVGNYIGLALDGTAAQIFDGVGIDLTNSKNDTIGGTSAADRNVISGNAIGITLGQNAGQLLQNATIEGNFIGTDPTGQSIPANQVGGQTGIEIFSIDNTIGGTDAGAGNVIAFNSQGVLIRASSNSGNAILGNSIHDNGTGIEIDGPNNKQPFPLLVFAIQTGTTTKINGILNAAANTTYSVQIFASPTDNGGQAKTLLGTVSTTSDSSGFAGFTFNAQVPANAGSFFTSIATSSSRNSSEISFPVGLSSSANEAFVGSAYGILLQRTPENSGTIDPPMAGSPFWVDLLNGGASTATVLLGIQASTEYLSIQVRAMYQLYLQRVPDNDGFFYWRNFLQAGGTFEVMAEVMTSSDEYFALQGGTNQGFITGLYHDVLNRTPSDAEVAGWLAALDNGTSRIDVSVAFLTSQEYRTNLVQADYMTFLLRPADPGGLAAWVNALNAGATDQDVIAGIFGSPEGYQFWS